MITHREDQKVFNPYEALGLNPNGLNVTINDIKRAFRKLALIWHPDKNNNSEISVTKFEGIKTAYELLTDDTQRVSSSNIEENYSQAALECVLKWKDGEDSIGFRLIKGNPDILKGIGTYLAEGLVTLKEFQDDDIPFYSWHVFSNDNYFFKKFKVKIKGSVKEYVKRYTDCKKIEAVRDKLIDRSIQFDLFHAQFFWLYMLPLRDIFGVNFETYHNNELDDLKWMTISKILCSKNYFFDGWYEHEALKRIGRIYNGPYSCLRKIYKTVILPMRTTIKELQQKCDTISHRKAEQLELIIVNIEENLLKEIPNIIESNFNINRPYEVDVFDVVVKVLEPYTKQERIEGYANQVKFFIKALLGSFLSLISFGLTLTSSNFRHTFFHNDAKYPVWDAKQTMNQFQKDCYDSNTKFKPFL